MQSVAAVVLFKDKTAQVIVSINSKTAHSSNSLGTVAFKFIGENVYPLDLTDPFQLKTFAIIFCGILATVSTSSEPEIVGRYCTDSMSEQTNVCIPLLFYYIIVRRRVHENY